MPEPSSTAPTTTVNAPETPGVQPGQVEREFTVRERSQWQQAMRRFLRHRLAVGSLTIFLLLVVFAFLGPLVWKYKYTTITPDNSVGPGLGHPFGTDNLGHDLFAEVMRGLQQSIKVALLIALLATTVGALWGVFSGYYKGLIDASLMRFADLLLTIPQLALAAGLANHFGGTWWIIGIILGGLSAPYVARVVRGMVLSLREREFIEAARALGASDMRIMLVHLVPNAMAVVIVNATLLVAAGVLSETALSFFGFGIQAPDTSLGLLVSAGEIAVLTRPWLFYFPGLFIIVFALTVNFIGDGLRDALDPHQTRQRR
jgi:glutathione transport system permease protein